MLNLTTICCDFLATGKQHNMHIHGKNLMADRSEERDEISSLLECLLEPESFNLPNTPSVRTKKIGKL